MHKLRLVVLSWREFLAVSGDIFGCDLEGYYWHLVGRGQWMLLYILQCTGQLLRTKKYVAPRV